MFPDSEWIPDTHAPDDVFDHCYPISFVSHNDKIATWLQVLSKETLFDGVREFCTSISHGQRTKAGFTKLVVDDFR